MHRKITILSILLLSCNFIFGQATKDRFVISPKVGIYAGGNTSGFISGLEFNTFVNDHVISMDYYRISELVIFSDSPAERINQIGIMLGKFEDSKSKLFRLELQGGIASLWGSERTDILENRESGFFGNGRFETRDFFTIGLVGKIGLKVNPLDNLGVGINIQANINHKNPMLMFMISIDLGKLK